MTDTSAFPRRMPAPLLENGAIAPPGAIVVNADEMPHQANKSLIDAMNVLRTVVVVGREIGASELSRELGLDFTRTHRLLKTLAAVGMLYRTESRKFVAGPATHVLANQAIFTGVLPQAASAALGKLRDETGHQVAMGLLWQRDVSYLYVDDGQTPAERALGNVMLFPASLSSLGLVLLGKMSDREIRKLYHKSEIPGYEEGGIRDLLKAIALGRKQGYSRVTRKTPGANVTIAIVLPSRPFMAIGIGGRDLPESETEQLLERLESCASEIDRSIEQG